ncbi:MAG: hypothetical protein FWG65_00835, partial [Turicibacter sp.]|nr:hypothetical protein [Turicibacter sp.]
ILTATAEETRAVGLGKCLYDFVGCLYAEIGAESATESLICCCVDKDEDGELPESVTLMQTKFEYFCLGEIVEDVVANALHQKSQPIMQNFIAALDYYLEYDAFLDFAALSDYTKRE